MPSSDQIRTETVPPSSDHYGTTKVVPPSDHLHIKRMQQHKLVGEKTHLPNVWGGGHGPRGPPGYTTGQIGFPLDTFLS